MTRRWERGLALAGAALGALLVVIGLAAVIAAGGLDPRGALVILAGLALLVAYALIERRRRPGVSGVLVSAFAAGLLVGINVLAAGGSAALDLTRSGLYTLSDRSVQVTRQLQSDLLVTGVFRPEQRDQERDARTLLDLYRARSSHVRIRFVDPDDDAAVAPSLGGATAGSLVLQYGTRPPVVLTPDQQSEADLTGAILRLESRQTPTVCWAGGDGERDLRDADEVTGYSAVAELLRTSSYHTEQVVPDQQAVPAACDALAVVQLGRPLPAAGVTNIQNYLAGGGKLLFALDPWVDPQIVASANALLQPYGVAFDGSLVIEPDPAHSATGDSTVPVVYDFGLSPITSALDRRYVFLPAATPITGAPAPGTTSVALAATSDSSYAIAQERSDLSRRGGDRQGPFTVLRSIEAPRSTGTARIVVAGTSALAENRTMPPAATSANSELLLSSLDWLTRQDALVPIPAKPPRAAPLTMSDGDARWMALLAVPLPVLVIVAAGAAVFLRRRAS